MRVDTEGGKEADGFDRFAASRPKFTGTDIWSEGTGNVPIHRHIAGSLGWSFSVPKYKNILQVKCTEAILSNSTQKLLWLEITKMLITV